MERRNFILNSGRIVTAAAFLAATNGSFPASASGFPSSNNSKEKDKRPQPDQFTEPILKAIAIGMNAPSPHNTQSWKFKILNDHEMLLYVDENILLPATDPPARQIHIGAGCFIETLVLGATSIGFQAAVDYFPEGYTATDFGKKPVARISLQKDNVFENRLAPFIYSRQTNRRVYKGEMIRKSEFDAVTSAAQATHSKTKFITDIEAMKPYLDIFYRGFEIESRTFRTNEETRLLFRYSEKDRSERRNGISIPQMGFKGMIKWFAEMSLDDGNKEKWHSEKSIDLSLKSVKKGIESSRGIIIWTTEKNDFIDHLKMGRDYVRFSLAAMEKNLYMHPYNQAIQEYDEMRAVRDEMNTLVGVGKDEKIQMIVRIGRSSKPYFSYRKNVSEMVIK